MSRKTSNRLKKRAIQAIALLTATGFLNLEFASLLQGRAELQQARAEGMRNVAAFLFPTKGDDKESAAVLNSIIRNNIRSMEGVKLMEPIQRGSEQNVEQGIAAVIQEGKVRTYDLGGSSTALDVARAVAERL